MKKALSLLLVLVLALGMSTVAFAAQDGKVDAIDTSIPWWTDSTMEYTGVDFTVQHNRVWKSGDFIDQAIFLDDDATVASAGVALTENGLKKSKITVEMKASKGGQYLDSTDFIYNGTGKSVSGIQFEMKDVFPSNNEDGVEYSYRLYISISKKINGDKSTYGDPVIVSGEYKNDSVEIDDEDFYNFADGEILLPQTFVKNLEGWLDGEGNGVLRMRALKGAKYWAVGSHDDWTEFDDSITEKYPAIDGVYHIQQRGLGNVVNNVEFPNYDPTYYVYTPDGETLKYVGRAGAKNLPLLDTYYFSVAELDVDEFEPDDEDDDDDEDWDYDENSEGGGDDLYPSNPHDNPGTGK